MTTSKVLDLTLSFYESLPILPPRGNLFVLEAMEPDPEMTYFKGVKLTSIRYVRDPWSGGWTPGTLSRVRRYWLGLFPLVTVSSFEQEMFGNPADLTGWDYVEDYLTCSRVYGPPGVVQLWRFFRPWRGWLYVLGLMTAEPGAVPDWRWRRK